MWFFEPSGKTILVSNISVHFHLCRSPPPTSHAVCHFQIIILVTEPRVVTQYFPCRIQNVTRLRFDCLNIFHIWYEIERPWLAAAMNGWTSQQVTDRVAEWMISQKHGFLVLFPAKKKSSSYFHIWARSSISQWNGSWVIVRPDCPTRLILDIVT